MPIAQELPGPAARAGTALFRGPTVADRRRLS